jgi:hypothetical protein
MADTESTAVKTPLNLPKGEGNTNTSGANDEAAIQPTLPEGGLSCN